MKKLLIAVLIFANSSLYADNDNSISVYPFGGTFHFTPRSITNDGNLNYLAVSKSYKKNRWNFENGVGTFIDSYHVRSYIAFTDISHARYKYGLITPMINLHCAYKGIEHTSNKRDVSCYPAVKLRIGKEKGVFVNVTPIPPLGDLTDGQLSFEVGYKF